MVGLEEHRAGADVHLVIMIGQAQHPAHRQRAVPGAVARFIEFAVRLGGRQVDDLHEQVVLTLLGQTIDHQLAHADHRNHITVRLGGRHRHIGAQADGSRQDDAARVGRLDSDQAHRLRNRHAATPPRPLESVATHRLGQQVEPQGRAQRALGLAVEHRYVLIALGSSLQLALGIQVGNEIIRRSLLLRHALERRPLGTADARRPGVGLGAMQERLGVAVEILARDRAGIDEEALETIQALLLIFEALFDAAITFAGQQLETLAQLLLIQIEGRPGQQPGQYAAKQQYH